jgi:peptidylprolyl isomerase
VTRIFIAFALLFAGLLPAAAQAPTTLVLETTKGPVTIRLRPDIAPKHAERLATLARQGFFDGIVFHRVIDGFMAQTGDPTGTGTGGSSLPNLKAEFSKTPFVRGTVGMARSSDPNSANSQFFIMFADGSPLNGQYTVVGEVVSGMENVDKIKRGEPVQNPDKIIKATAP